MLVKTYAFRACKILKLAEVQAGLSVSACQSHCMQVLESEIHRWQRTCAAHCTTQSKHAGTVLFSGI